MIQRIQSIYLTLAAICGLILFLVPVFQLVPDITAIDNASYQMSLLSVNSIVNDVSSFQMRFYPLIILNLLAVITSLTTVFLFKKRKLQITQKNPNASGRSHGDRCSAVGVVTRRLDRR